MVLEGSRHGRPGWDPMAAMHTDRRGCWGDPCANRSEIEAKLEAGGLCPECRRLYASADLAGDYPALQYVPPQHDYWIDILARLGEAFRYSDLESEVVEVDGVPVRVATPRMLYLMKRDTVRPQDRLDAETLRQRFAIAEEK